MKKVILIEVPYNHALVLPGSTPLDTIRFVKQQDYSGPWYASEEPLNAHLVADDFKPAPPTKEQRTAMAEELRAKAERMTKHADDPENGKAPDGNDLPF
jgi:hypothetical protein